ncbi:vesicle transport protein SFT2B [Pelomyxa schiedti]|nr:vesicle transport protein SFT2B [Pelomyxa schiedti]
MDSIKNLISGESSSQPQEPSVFDQFDDYLKLSLKTRILGFAITVGIGVVMLIIGFCVFVISPTTFVILYTLSNISFIASTLFIVGPVRQLKNMFNVHRIIATSVFLISIILTIVVVVMDWSFILALICAIIQMGALFWYVITYIPGAQNCLKNAISGAIAV